MNVDEASRFLRDIISDPKTNVESVNRATLALRELQPEPRIIDWQRVVDNRLPVKVRNNHPGELAFLRVYTPGIKTPFSTYAGGHFVDASLETGQWVFNSTGKNVWPEGVLVEVWVNNKNNPGPVCIPSGVIWAHDEDHWIVASRAVGLEEGWSYGGGE